MKLITLCGHLAVATGREMSDFTELLRALKEGSTHFANIDIGAIKASEEIPTNRFIAKSGPGGGLDADPFHTAFVVLALMLDAPRREVAIATWRAWHISHRGSILSGWGEDFEPTLAECKLTRRHLFGEAFKATLSDPELAKRVSLVRVDARSEIAEIHYDGDEISEFEEEYHRRTEGLRIVGELSGNLLHRIAVLITRQ